ncbi:MAG: DUF2066 domain-containing protein, partial [Gammaproteobacteria bacterium]|nr:DUF2066 domain-containing protein [Gammaproteobacteria bacterium]
ITGDFSLNVELRATFRTLDMPAYRDAVQRLNLDFMQIVARRGSGFAFPSRTVYMAQDGGIGAAAPAVVVFDTAALERAITAAGRSVWATERPVVLVIVLSAPTGADPVAVKGALEAAGFARGLPLRFTNAQAAGFKAGDEPTGETVLAVARRLGADAALIGQADGQEWQWTLFDRAGSSVFPGAVTAGVEAAAELLSSSAQAAEVLAESYVTLRVAGVSSLADHVRAQRLAAALAGVRGVWPLEVETERASFRLSVAGGTPALLDALKSVPQLSGSQAAGDRIDVRLER